MSDPYKVLGVSPNATDEQVKSAYRELARKYHPDNYVNNPLADLAQEKMKEINEAYEQIQSQRKAGRSRGFQNSGSQQSAYQSYNSGSYRQASSFADIRRLLQQNRIIEAEELLKGTPLNQRTAEWYFLMGNIHYSRGWLDEAYNHFSKACSMEPGNPEYRNAFNQLAFQRNTGHAYGGNYSGGYGGTACSGCDICTTLFCADCCCECMGGDLFRCC